MRITDNPDFIYESRQFTPRNRRPAFIKLLVFYSLAMLSIVLVSVFRDLLGGDYYASMLVFIIALMIAFYTAFARQQNLDTVLATEFQNMIFSAAASLGSDFCIFLKQDGTMIYADDGARRTFRSLSQDETLAIDSLLDRNQVAASDRDQIYRAMIQGTRARMIFQIPNKQGETKDYIITIEPLRRPEGYVVLRGREYYTQREGTVKMPQQLAQTTVEKISHLLAMIDEGTIVTNEYGRIEFANETLEKALGYEAGELVSHRPLLQQIIHRPGVNADEPVALQDGDHEWMLIHRNGSLRKAHYRMRVVRNGEQKPIGMTATMRFPDLA